MVQAFTKNTYIKLQNGNFYQNFCDKCYWFSPLVHTILITKCKWFVTFFTTDLQLITWQSNLSNHSFILYVHPKLDLVNFAVRPLLFTKSCSSLNWICSKNEIGWNYSELKDINLKYILSKDSLRYININLPMFCNS